MTDEVDPDLLEFLMSQGYHAIRVIDGDVCGVKRMIFTTGVCHGMDKSGLRGRFCFETVADAMMFLMDWDGKTLPVVGEDGCTAIKGEMPLGMRRGL